MPIRLWVGKYKCICLGINREYPTRIRKARLALRMQQRIDYLIRLQCTEPSHPLRHIRVLYEFRRRIVKGSNNRKFLSFNPAICKEAKKEICKTIRRTGIRSRSELSLQEVADRLNPMLYGWINYYGKYNKSALKPVMRQINFTLIKWSMNKYKAYRFSKAKATQLMIETFEKQPWLFAHWKQGVSGSFV
ncbi:MAG: hypothetical protein LEGION0403_FIIPPAGN_02363 [Legionella sp.]